MELHGDNPQQPVIIVIPARYSSTRLPGKLLLPIAGKPLLLHTLDRAKQAETVSRIIVATDDERIATVVRQSGNEVRMTSPDHLSGSDRVAEVALDLPQDAVIVNVQGDEPLISRKTIDQTIAAFLRDKTIDIATSSEPLKSGRELFDPNVVKVVTDSDGFALYFSRSPVPYPREAVQKFGSFDAALSHMDGLLSMYCKHTGLYVYRRRYLLHYRSLPPSFLERVEMLEQLRALSSGARIKVVQAEDATVGVDTMEDYERVKEIIETGEIMFRQATTGDISAVAQVHVDSWRRSFSGLVPHDFLESMSVTQRTDALRQRVAREQFYRMYVAEDPLNGIVGFADFGRPRDGQPFDAELYAIYFLSEYQRCGIGSRLFRLCQNEMIKNGFNSMCLDSLEVSPYRNFYEKMGGRIVGNHKHDLAGVEFKTVIYGWNDLKAII